MIHDFHSCDRGSIPRGGICPDNDINLSIKVSMAEWSNATDLRSVLFGGAGSNPAGDKLRFLTAISTTPHFLKKFS